MPRYVLKKVFAFKGDVDGKHYDYCRVECEMKINPTDGSFGLGTRVFDVGTSENMALFDQCRPFFDAKPLEIAPIVVEFEYDEELTRNEQKTVYIVDTSTLKFHFPRSQQPKV
ncbi:hypothetical protein [Vitreoscilla stercoraria]|uniref:Uncharacterized protein n=1 Tax=Vitreoscilla stercoraria TaxID=61 RepID=A0ABY4E6F7_VITST|nr:hypothetical protein [Vitreoscilla stercoraria]UOO91345.1 hypothetical protein LVJ81_06605 [Vitreoscilla stercoraria]